MRTRRRWKIENVPALLQRYSRAQLLKVLPAYCYFYEMSFIPLFLHWCYNVRSELISADDVSYAYDDIGIYAPTSVSEVGNQTLIKTETGIWSVLYNAENRPIRWQSGDTVITMAFDRMGRRIEMRTVKDDEETLQRFVYDNYLCVSSTLTCGIPPNPSLPAHSSSSQFPEPFPTISTTVTKTSPTS